MGIEHTITIDYNTHNIEMVRPIERTLTLPILTLKNILLKSEVFGYSTCTTYCAGHKPDLPKGTVYSYCWNIDEEGNEVRIFETA